MSNSNYHQLIKSQEDIIKKHYSTPIYTSITRPAIIPVIKKKLNLKKSIKQKTTTNSDEEELQQTKKRHDTNFIIED